MLDALLAADLLILTVCQLVTLWHCFNKGAKATLFAGYLTERAEHLTEAMNEAGGLLNDIADILDSQDDSGPLNMPNPMAGGSIGEVLTTALLSRVIGGEPHGTPQKPDREIHEDNPETPEPVSESPPVE